MPLLQLLLLSNFLLNVSIDLFEVDPLRIICVFVAFLVSLTFILDEQVWFKSNTEKLLEWLKTLFVSYVVCELTLFINFVHLLVNKYNDPSMSWCLPSLVLLGLWLYRRYQRTG
ncbi:hypothetical protein CGI24_24175 [Vibrio parahaemolyticus]|nr:hypothetical protein CGI24_24175 [Vibrio parahaemolyticus]TOK64555.1 hypothetical protein CGI14_23540 [Vibrio parahaemolyticus]TON58057.1 hypothetical protein CGH54_23685 [Vibrio parahaemolyticus]